MTKGGIYTPSNSIYIFVITSAMPTENLKEITDISHS